MSTVKPWHKWPPGLRAFIFQRDHNRCQIMLADCTGTAQELDHKTPPPHGGAWFDPSNLQASCRSCNRRKGDRPLAYPTYPHTW